MKKEHIGHEIMEEDKLETEKANLHEIYYEFFESDEFKNITLFYKISIRSVQILFKSVYYLISECKTIKELDDLLTNINIKPNTIISNEDSLKYLYFIDPTYKKLNPYKKGIIEELELPERKTNRKTKGTPPFMQVTL